MSIDEVLSYYLYKISTKVKQDFYVQILRCFVLPFRECVNKYGWEKKAQEELKQNEDDSHLVKSASDAVQDRAQRMQAQQDGVEFSVINNSEHAPEVCNEFVTVYYMENNKSMGISKEDVIDYTRNLCHWLFEECFTASRISLIKQ